MLEEIILVWGIKLESWGRWNIIMEYEGFSINVRVIEFS